MIIEDGEENGEEHQEITVKTGASTFYFFTSKLTKNLLLSLAVRHHRVVMFVVHALRLPRLHHDRHLLLLRCTCHWPRALLHHFGPIQLY